MLYEYDPISCIGMKVSTKDSDFTISILRKLEYATRRAKNYQETHNESFKNAAYELLNEIEQQLDKSKDPVEVKQMEQKFNKTKSYIDSIVKTKDSKVHDAKTKDEESYFESMRPKKI